MFISKQNKIDDKQLQENRHLQTYQESDIQDRENLESTEEENSLQFTLKGAEIKTKQNKTDLEHDENNSIKDMSTVQPSMTNSPSADGHKHKDDEKESVSEVGEMKTSERKFVETSEDKSGRISRFLERSHQELSKTVLLEELEKTRARLASLEIYKKNVQQEIAKVKTIGSLRREQLRQEFASFHDLLRQKEEKMLEQLDQEVDERVMHVTNTLQASVVSLEKQDANLTTTVTELVQSHDDTRFTEKYVKAKDLCHKMDVRVKEFHRDLVKDSMYTPSPVLDNYFTLRLERRDLSEKLDEAMELPKLRFKQKKLLTYPRSPVRISAYIECSGVPPSTDVLYTLQLFHKRILVYEQTSKNLQDLRLNDFTTFNFVPGMTYLLKVTSDNICHVFQDQGIRRTSSCQMVIHVKQIYPTKAPKVEGNSKNSETAININERAALPHQNDIKLHTTTNTIARERLEALKRRQIKLHRMKTK